MIVIRTAETSLETKNVSVQTVAVLFLNDAYWHGYCKSLWIKASAN